MMCLRHQQLIELMHTRGPSFRPLISGLSNCTWPTIDYVLQVCEKGHSH